MFPNEKISIPDTRLLGKWGDYKVPVFDVKSIHGLNQMVGYVKHINADAGTVLYRGQVNLHPKLIPSILHGDPSDYELKRRRMELDSYIGNIINDPLMNISLHYGQGSTRYFYKRHLIESMLQHYGVRTYFQDFVDNHWCALWFGLYEQKSKICGSDDTGKIYYEYFYKRRNSESISIKEKPSSLDLAAPLYDSIPQLPTFKDEINENDIELLKNFEGYKDIIENVPASRKQECITHFVRRLNRKVKNENLEKMRKWQARKDKIEQNNADLKAQYELDNRSRTEYMYLLLYVADTRRDCFNGVYASTESVTIDLRKALPSTMLRPCAQHGWTVKRYGDNSDLSDGVVCVLRLSIKLVSEMLGTGKLVSQENFFPPADRDWGYRILLSREEPAPFGVIKPKKKKDLPSLFPYSALQHYVVV